MPTLHLVENGSVLSHCRRIDCLVLHLRCKANWLHRRLHAARRFWRTLAFEKAASVVEIDNRTPQGNMPEVAQANANDSMRTEHLCNR